MSQESPAEDALSLEELSGELADATGPTPEEIERPRGLERPDTSFQRATPTI